MIRLLVLLTVITASCVNMHASAQEKASDRSTKEYVYKIIGERKLKMHVDFPPGWKETDTRPVIVFFHGGGWKGGSVVAFAHQAEYFAGRGLVCARVEYRILSKDGVTPDKCVEDARQRRQVGASQRGRTRNRSSKTDLRRAVRPEATLPPARSFRKASKLRTMTCRSQPIRKPWSCLIPSFPSCMEVSSISSTEMKKSLQRSPHPSRQARHRAVHRHVRDQRQTESFW